MERTRVRKRRQRKGETQVVEHRAPFIQRKLGTYNVLSEEGLELIEANADRILAETGMEFHDDPEILTIFAEAGCEVDGTRVRFAPGFCRETIKATAPSQSLWFSRSW